MSIITTYLTEHGATCEWFARCNRPAVHLVQHPVLVLVPVCQHCTDRLGLTPVADDQVAFS